MSQSLGPKELRFHIVRFKEIDSTNTYAAQCAREGAKEGTVIVSDYQTKGRGRFRRKWISAPGENLLFSIILRPRHGAHRTPLLTLLAAHVLKSTLEAYAGVSCTIKKPNDIMIKGKKVCGILTEATSKNGEVAFVILGIGINVNSTKNSITRGATTLREERGMRLSRKMLLAQFLKNFKSEYARFNK
jgi:BirA family biotin operon repressor/biotin-[acetyl-CoA-carboxylase] ligase